MNDKWWITNDEGWMTNAEWWTRSLSHDNCDNNTVLWMVG